jgi:hypothetical protein
LRTITSNFDYSIPGNCQEGMNGRFPEKKRGDKSAAPRRRIARACTASPASWFDQYQVVLDHVDLPYVVIAVRAGEGMNGKFSEKKYGGKNEVSRGRVARAFTASPASRSYSSRG